MSVQYNKKSKEPLVSIGMPVFNGENYIEKAIDSILAQKYQNFELIILDNASTDSTEQICTAYAVKDKRIRYYRNKKNIGVTNNFNRVYKLSSSKYFKWAAHDDIIAPDYILKCINVLEKDSSIVSCHSKTGVIDENDKHINIYYYNLRFDSKKQHERFRNMIWMLYPTWVLIFGVVRTSILSMTSLFGNYIGSDRNLLAEICLLGKIYEIPECLFYRRSHRQSYTNKKYSSTLSRAQNRMYWWTTTNSITFTYWKNCLEYIKSIKQMPLKLSTRVLCYIEIIKWFMKEGWLLMASDVAINLLGRTKNRKILSPILTVLFRIRRGRARGKFI